MAVENLPLWTVLPNWSRPITENLRWVSAVMGSPTGAEQRYAARRTPRRTLEAGFLAAGMERAWLDNAASAASAARWYVPIFTDLGRTTAAIEIGDTVIPVVTTGREFRVGGFVMLHADTWTATVREIVSLTADSITVATTLGGWPKGTQAMPCSAMRLTDAMSATRRNDRALETTLRFEVDGASPSTVATLADDYLGLPVLTEAPNETASLDTTHSRLLAEFGTDLSRRQVVDISGRGFTVQKHTWMKVGRTEQDALRAYFYALQGRRGSTWVPTFAADFDLHASAAADVSGIVTKVSGFVRFGGPRFNREHIRIELRDGTSIYRKITGAIETGDLEYLALDSVLGVAITPQSVKRISFLARCRLDQDAVEFTHYTDKQGAVSVAAAFKSAGDFRTAEPFVPVPLASPYQIMLACGFEIPGSGRQASAGFATGSIEREGDGGISYYARFSYASQPGDPATGAFITTTPGVVCDHFRIVVDSDYPASYFSSFTALSFDMQFPAGRPSEGVTVVFTSAYSDFSYTFTTDNWAALIPADLGEVGVPAWLPGLGGSFQAVAPGGDWPGILTAASAGDGRGLRVAILLRR